MTQIHFFLHLCIISTDDELMKFCDVFGERFQPRQRVPFVQGDFAAEIDAMACQTGRW